METSFNFSSAFAAFICPAVAPAPRMRSQDAASSCLSHPSGSVGGREWWVFTVVTKEGTLLCLGGSEGGKMWQQKGSRRR